MYIKSSEYLSTHTGKQIDDAIDSMRDYDAELALKADKATEINGYKLDSNIDLTAGDVGALPANTQYGFSLNYENGKISLMDRGGALLSSQLLSDKQDIITPENMLSSDLVDDEGKVHKFATVEQLTQIATNTSAIASNTSAIGVINSKIPSQATPENQLSDKNFVNSSIATNTAYFIGTFQSVEDLENYSGTLTNNDYAFVETTDSVGNAYYDRYKYNSSTETWAFEYKLNNSKFTADQWASINSGLSSNDKTQIATNTSAIASNTASIEALGTALEEKSSVTFVDWTTE